MTCIFCRPHSEIGGGETKPNGEDWFWTSSDWKLSLCNHDPILHPATHLQLLLQTSETNQGDKIPLSICCPVTILNQALLPQEVNLLPFARCRHTWSFRPVAILGEITVINCSVGRRVFI